MKKEEKIQKEILKKLHRYFDRQGLCTQIDAKADILYVHHGLSLLYVDEDYFNLAFDVSCDPTSASHITLEVIQFASKYQMDVDIQEPYAEVVDEKGIVLEVLFGDDAREYYETGEVPIKKEKEKLQETGIKPEADIDPQKKFDAILDQISKHGMESLNKHEKEFLVRFSKDKSGCSDGNNSNNQNNQPKS